MDLITFDFETSGTLPEYALQPWRVRTGDAWVTSIAIAKRDYNGKLWADGCLEPHSWYLRDFLTRAIESDCYIGGWNTVFDIAWLLAHGLEDLVFKCKWLDGMLLWRHYSIEPQYDLDRNKKKSYSLKAYVPEFMPYMAGYERDIDFHSRDPEDLRKLQLYNEQDTVATLLGIERFWSLLSPKQQHCALIESACLPMIARANLHGLPVDVLVTRELSQYLADIAAVKLKELAPHGINETIIRSPLQLANLLFDEWGLPVYKETLGKKTGKISRSTDKEALHELSLKDPRARELRTYREALNTRTKFAETILKSVEYNKDGRTHPEAIVFGTYSGRLTYSSSQGKNKNERQTGFALHQEKRDPKFRNVIVPPEGYVLMEFDAAGQEYRWMAIASDDETMLSLCEPGQDAHAFMGAKIARWDYQELIAAVHEGDQEAKDARFLGKVANLSLQYRTSARKLQTVARVQHDLPLDLPEAQRIHATYRATYPEVVVYWRKQIAETKRLGYVETFAGRRVQVVGNWDGQSGWSMASTAINYRIQGTGADQKYLALSVLRSYLIRNGIYFAWDLHDGLYFFVPQSNIDRATTEIKSLLDNLPYKKAWGFTPPISLPWDCKVGPSWGALKERNHD
jgi:DNA polymerase-1